MDRLRKSLIVALALALAPWGCSDPVQRQLQGRWLGESVRNVDAAQLAAVTAWVRGTSFEFSGNSVTVTIPTELPRTAPYEVTQATEQNLVLAIRNPNGAIDTASLTLESQGVLRWHIGDGRSILMRRVD